MILILFHLSKLEQCFLEIPAVIYQVLTPTFNSHSHTVNRAPPNIIIKKNSYKLHFNM